MTRSHYLVGIDLGTTNCAVAYVDTHGRERPTADIRNFPVPQLVAPGETAPRVMLPSFLYLPGEHELPPGAARLPWNDRGRGDRGRIRAVSGCEGARPQRHQRQELALSFRYRPRSRHPAVGQPARGEENIPGGGVGRLSAAHSRRLERHICADDRLAASRTAGGRADGSGVVRRGGPRAHARGRQARELASVTLLEEPQAAFYCWIVSHQDRWQKEVRAGELILVCDIGGGTTDFSLITVVETPTGPGFRRVAVGDHLMLGGDNMDLALAHHVEKKLGGARLDSEQWSALRSACRTAKEKLLGEEQPALERWPVTIAGRGSKLIGGSIQAELTRKEVETIAIEGFFPMTRRDENPDRGPGRVCRSLGFRSSATRPCPSI